MLDDVSYSVYIFVMKHLLNKRKIDTDRSIYVYCVIINNGKEEFRIYA